ncbi:DUF6265 family protein [Sphingomonas sanxanigenens]|uniref:DUF6265 domain-containing protein n=1 Tax=Sphingomonas sanxanigenens DSM 19645 = NX02 TaxID=1123269 RepID=W0ALG9_9SPHN|nr:DUF6265 family protein [Sphingomonas sanxanigenens]AHE57153.1 hypothetical protein NX02_27850 [Sphingomonas sanxanigenens DSM 19645 = NX02]
MLRVLLASAMLLASGVGAAQSADGPIIGDRPQSPHRLPATDLDWLSGDWRAGNAADGITIEHWEPMRGGTKLGIGQTLKGGVTRGFEYMRIVRHVDGLVFYGQPSGKPAVAFPAVVLREDPAGGTAEIVFANPQHDYPTHISYRLAEGGTMLVATTRGRDPARDTMTWQYHRIAPDGGM